MTTNPGLDNPFHPLSQLNSISLKHLIWILSYEGLLLLQYFCRVCVNTKKFVFNLQPKNCTFHKIVVRLNMKLVVLLFAGICLSVAANQAGVHLLVAQSGLDMVTNIVKPFLTESVNSLEIPDVSDVSGLY